MCKSLTIVVLSLLISSCTSVYRNYSGSPQPDSNIGIIYIPNTVPVHPVVISYVDGKRRGIGLIRRYELTPGERELNVVSFGRLYRNSNVITYFTVDAGKKYSIERILDRKIAKDIFGVDVFGKNNWYVLIKEKGSNTVVNYPESKPKLNKK